MEAEKKRREEDKIRRQQMMAGFGQPMSTDRNFIVSGKGERPKKISNLAGQSKNRGLSKEQQEEAKVCF